MYNERAGLWDRALRILLRCAGVRKGPALAGGRPPRFKQKGSCGDQVHTQPWAATVCRLISRKRTG